MQKEKVCEMCGEKYFPTGNAQRYCRRPECMKSKLPAGKEAQKKSLRWCVVCGKKIPELSARKKTCSAICSKKRKAGHSPYENFTEPPKLGLTEVQRLAQERGLSYGKYVAIYDN